MAHFLPADEQKAAALSERLARTIFKSPADFVNLYNSGLINKKFPDVTALAHEITSNYRDVKEKNGRLIFISQQEIFLEELLRGLDKWGALVKVKRELNQLLADEVLTEDSVVYFLAESVGYIYLRNEEGDYDRAGNEKLFSNYEAAVKLYQNFGGRVAREEDMVAFVVSELAHQDDTFIGDMHRLLP